MWSQTFQLHTQEDCVVHNILDHINWLLVPQSHGYIYWDYTSIKATDIINQMIEDKNMGGNIQLSI